jgi:hypothetical protein
MEVTTMMQGDSYGLSIEILNSGGEAVTSADVSDVEISIGSLKKTYTSGDVFFVDGMWVFPLTQEETFQMLPAKVKVQLRVKWLSGDVEGCDLGYQNIRESISKEVL